MSIFREIAEEFKNEIKRELEKASAEFNIQPAQQRPASPVASGSQPQRARMDSGVVEHASGQSSAQRPRTKKQKKKAPVQSSGTTIILPNDTNTQDAQVYGTQTYNTQPQNTQTQASVKRTRLNQIRTGLNPQTARNAILMAEIIGRPVSKRQHKRI